MYIQSICKLYGVSKQWIEGGVTWVTTEFEQKNICIESYVYWTVHHLDS